MVQTDFYICGLAPFLNKNNAENQFLILCYEKLGNEENIGAMEIPEDSRPHIRVIDIHPDSFEETSPARRSAFASWTEPLIRRI